MPRINIDDKLFADQRFLDFVFLLSGDRYRAIGICVVLFQTAQRYWLNNKQLIPLTEFKKIPCFEFLIKSGLVQRKRAGVYVCGSRDYFAWIVSKIDSSRKGGESLKKKWADTRPIPGPPSPYIVKINPPVSARARAEEFSLQKLEEEIKKRSTCMEIKID